MSIEATIELLREQFISPDNSSEISVYAGSSQSSTRYSFSNTFKSFFRSFSLDFPGNCTVASSQNGFTSWIHRVIARQRIQLNSKQQTWMLKKHMNFSRDCSCDTKFLNRFTRESCKDLFRDFSQNFTHFSTRVSFRATHISGALPGTSIEIWQRIHSKISSGCCLRDSCTTIDQLMVALVQIPTTKGFLWRFLQKFFYEFE